MKNRGTRHGPTELLKNVTKRLAKNRGKDQIKDIVEQRLIKNKWKDG